MFFTASEKVLNNFKNGLFPIKNLEPEPELEAESKLERESELEIEPKYRKF